MYLCLQQFGRFSAKVVRDSRIVSRPEMGSLGSEVGVYHPKTQSVKDRFDSCTSLAFWLRYYAVTDKEILLLMVFIYVEYVFF